MGFNTAGLNAACDGIATAGDRISFHTADPGTNGTSEVTGGGYLRQTTTWGAASGGTRVGSQVATTVPATTLTHWGIWTAGGAFLGGNQLSAPQVFGTPGTFQYTPTLSALN